MLANKSYHFSNALVFRILLICVILFITINGISTVLFYNYTNQYFFISIFPATKDLALIGIGATGFLIYFIRNDFVIRKRLVLLYFVFLFLLCILCLYYLTSIAPHTNRLYTLRQLLVIFFGFFVFLQIDEGLLKANDLLKILRILTWGVCLFGFFEYLMPASFWNDLVGLEKYANSRLLGGTEVKREYSSDLIFLIGRPVRRMMSFFAEPTALGSFLTTMFTLFLFNPDHKKYNKVLLVFMTICGFLVFSKIFIVSFFISLSYYLVLRKPAVWPLYGMTVVLFFVSQYLYSIFGKIHGSFAHLFGFYTGVVGLEKYPMGLGLGVSGNRGIEMYRSAMGEFGSESGLGSILSQMGFFGLLVPLLFFLILIEYKKLFKEHKEPIFLACFVILINYFLNFYLSFASLGISGNILTFMLLGYFINRRKIRPLNA